MPPLERKLHKERDFWLFINYHVPSNYNHSGHSVNCCMNEQRNSCLITPAHQKLPLRSSTKAISQGELIRSSLT